MRSAFAPGRVNLIGDHTDYTGGYVFPLAIQLGTTVTFEPREGSSTIVARSGAEADEAELPLKIKDPSKVEPPWARYVAGVIAEIRPAAAGALSITTTLPLGDGLASSAALEVAVAMALGYAGTPGDLAEACQRSERRAVGVPCGIMDPLSSVSGRDGHALLIDCSSNQVKPIPVPPDCEIVTIPSGESHSLPGSGYAERRQECEQAATFVGPLRSAALVDLDAIPDGVLRRRARHVITENQRVVDFAEALRHGHLRECGEMMFESHRSLRDDFQVSTPALDDVVARLTKTKGVFGARLTGAGFGGSVVALTRPGALEEGRIMKPSPGARLL